MSHTQQLNFIKNVVLKYPNYFINSKVIEIGSYDINGSVRQFFNNCNYTGIDVTYGTSVDRVCFGHEILDPDGSYDVTISTECFEHDFYYIKTFSNMIRLCKSNGLVIFTCASLGRPEHGTQRTSPHESLTSKIDGIENYYKNLTELDFVNNFDLRSIFKYYEFHVNNESFDLYFAGIKN